MPTAADALPNLRGRREVGIDTEFMPPGCPYPSPTSP